MVVKIATLPPFFKTLFTFFNSLGVSSMLAIDSQRVIISKFLFSNFLSVTSPRKVLTLNFVLATELAFWEKAEEKMMALEASVPLNGLIVVESCVTGDTIILTGKGPMAIKDVHDWGNNCLGFSEGEEIQIDGHYGMQPTTTYYNSGVQDGYRITTKCGYSVGMSSVHKMFVLRGDELVFVESKDLQIGDLLAIKYGQDMWGRNDSIDWIATPYGYNKGQIKLFNEKIVTKDLAYLIGLILGDGYVDFKHGRVVITTVDDEISEFLLQEPFSLKFKQSKGADKYHYVCKNQSFVEFLSKYIRFEQVRSPKKEITKTILGWSRENVSSFLSGLFDADGCCRKDRHSVSFVSTSKKLIDTVQVLLLNFGIICRRYEKDTPPAERVKVWSHSYVLELTEGQSKIFGKVIGFRIKRKQNSLRAEREEYDCLSNIIPGIGKVLKCQMKQLGLGYSDITNGLNKGFFSKSGNITYKTLGIILDKCRNKESDEFIKIKKLIDCKYLYDEVKTKEPIRENVYDFTVNNGHTVTYNGIVGHQTPNGLGNLYHKMWMSDNDYAKKEYGWWWGYTELEIETIKRRMNNPMRFAQEYSLEFLSSGRPVFDAMVVKAQRKNILNVGDKREDGLLVYEDKYGMRIYKEPDPDGMYIFGVDTSEGVQGGDYSVAIVWNRKTGEEVAMYRGLIEPDKFGIVLNDLGRKYNNALMVVEINNHGLTVLTLLRQLLYPSLYFRPTQFEKLSSSWSDKLGWKTTKITRPLLLDDLGQAMRDNLLIIHSKEMLDEMAVFVYDKNNNANAQHGFHDDMIFAGGIGYQGYKVMWDKELTQLNYEMHLPQSSSY